MSLELEALYREKKSGKNVVPYFDLETLGWRYHIFPRKAERWEWDMLSWDDEKIVEIPLLFAGYRSKQDGKIYVPSPVLIF